MKQWTNVDKTGWGDGPWTDEPDKMQWIDEATGLDCLIVRGPMGALCGYVGVPPEHPWHGIPYSGREYDYENREPVELGGGFGKVQMPKKTEVVPWDQAPESKVDVHGGLTYSGLCQEEAEEGKGICHIPEPGRPADVFWFGFDCAHYMDMCPVMEMHNRERFEDAKTERERELWGPKDFGETYKTVPYVQAEVTSLAAQLAAAAA